MKAFLRKFLPRPKRTLTITSLGHGRLYYVISDRTGPLFSGEFNFTNKESLHIPHHDKLIVNYKHQKL